MLKLRAPASAPFPRRMRWPCRGASHTRRPCHRGRNDARTILANSRFAPRPMAREGVRACWAASHTRAVCHLTPYNAQAMPADSRCTYALVAPRIVARGLSPCMSAACLFRSELDAVVCAKRGQGSKGRGPVAALVFHPAGGRSAPLDEHGRVLIIFSERLLLVYPRRARLRSHQIQHG